MAGLLSEFLSDMAATLNDRDVRLQATVPRYTPAVPVTLADLGYTGDLDATKGAPVGTLVGGTLAQIVVLNAANGNSALAALNNPPSITIGSAYSSGGTGVRTFTVGSTVTGGTSPFVYSWTFNPFADEPGLVLYSGVDTATVTMRSVSKSSGTSSSGMLTLTVRDAKGLTASKSTEAEAAY